MSKSVGEQKIIKPLKNIMKYTLEQYDEMPSRQSFCSIVSRGRIIKRKEYGR